MLERGFLLKLRFAFDHHVNLRPSKLYPGVGTPLAGSPEIDFVVVREGTEGPYTGNGGTIRTGTPHEVATEVSLNTAFGIERVVRDAYARAQARPRKKLTLVHKNNVLVHAGHLWTRIFEAVGAEFPDVTTDYLHVDAATIFLVTQPERFDVIVTDNLFGDIITDLAAAVSGGIGVAASGNINPARDVPVDVRAGARLGPGHRRPVQGRPDRDRALRRPAAPAPGVRGGGGPDRRRRPRRPGRAGRPARPQHGRDRRRARRPRRRLTPARHGSRSLRRLHRWYPAPPLR